MDLKLQISQKQVAQGWKPGAITKQLLRKLNKAKVKQSTQEHLKRTKKHKKQIEDKPTLIIAKHNGEYIIEMQVVNKDEANCDPLIYKITRESNDERIKARNKRERTLINEAVKEVWSDPFHPEVCDTVCYKAYQECLGIFPGDPLFEDKKPVEEDPSSTSKSDDEVDSSSCSSLDVDWEIHFTPPIYCNNA